MLAALTCGATTDANGTDEVFLILQADEGAPVRYPMQGRSSFSMSPDGVKRIGDDLPAPLTISFENNVNISAFDVDFEANTDGNDLLGSTTYRAYDSETSAFLGNGRESSYTLAWTIDHA